MFPRTMNLFRRRSEPADLAERLEKVSAALDERIGRLERRFRELDNDMDSLWDKVKHWTGRLAKRAAPSAEPTVGVGNVDPTASAAAATATEPDWQSRILARRNRAVPNSRP